MARYVDADRGLSWVRLETGFGSNPKILNLAHRKQWRAVVAYVAGLGYSGAQGLDGLIPDSAMLLVHATPKDRAVLVEVGLWLPVTGGVEIHDWHEYQPTSEQVQNRRAKAKQNIEKRWNQNRANKVRVIK